MHPFLLLRRLLLLGGICLLAGAARAQNNPVASPQVMASLMPVISLNPVPEPAELASYYDASHKDLQPGLRWMQEINNSLPTYWTLYAEARIHMALKHFSEAASLAYRAERLAQVAAPVSSPYLYLSADLLTDARRQLAAVTAASGGLASAE